MGRDKALIEVAGVTMAQRVAAVLQRAGCANVVAIGPPHLAAGLPVVPDEHPGEGPLGAILTALHAAAPHPALVVACDLPWLDVTTLRSLLSATDHPPLDRPAAQVVMAVTHQREPLCALWMPDAADALQRAFDAGERAVHRAVAQLVVAEVVVDPDALTNVNTPDDLPE